jgi:hypothetical protein
VGVLNLVNLHLRVGSELDVGPGAPVETLVQRLRDCHVERRCKDTCGHGHKEDDEFEKHCGSCVKCPIG